MNESAEKHEAVAWLDEKNVRVRTKDRTRFTAGAIDFVRKSLAEASECLGQ